MAHHSQAAHQGRRQRAVTFAGSDDLLALQDPEYLRWRELRMRRSLDDSASDHGAAPNSQFASELDGWREI